jgi:hypothetical protein
MSKKKIKRPVPSSQSDLSFSLSRWYRKVVATKPSTFVITVVVIGFAIFLFSGGLFSITRENIMPSWFNPNTGRFYFLYPDVSDQFVSDTVISMMLYTLGFVGLISIYQSTKSVYKPRQAYMMLIIGVSLVLLSYVFLEGAIMIKAAGIQ